MRQESSLETNSSLCMLQPNHLHQKPRPDGRRLQDPGMAKREGQDERHRGAGHRRRHPARRPGGADDRVRSAVRPLRPRGGLRGGVGGVCGAGSVILW